MADKLTEKQKRFADEYLVDLNAKQAAIRTGYSAKTAEQQASRLLSNVKVQEYIQNKQKKLEIKTELTTQWVLDNLKTVAERCMQAEPLYNKDGDIVEYTFQAPGANKALELIGKHLGMFTDKIEQKITGSLDLTSKPKEVLIEELKADLKKQGMSDSVIEKIISNNA
jgi:phage terminase small subunit